MDDIKSQEEKLTKFPYFQILEWMYKDLRLFGNALVIFGYMYRESNYYQRNKFNKTKIAKELGITNPTVISAFAKLAKAEIIKNIGKENNVDMYEINTNKIIAVIHDNVLKRLLTMIKKYNSSKSYDFKKELNLLFPNKKDGSVFKQIDNLKTSCNLKSLKIPLNK